MIISTVIYNINITVDVIMKQLWAAYVFADIFVFLHTTKTTVLLYNRLCLQGFPSSSSRCFKSVLKQFLGAFLCPVM